jgi:hypothetical protein
LVLSQLLLVRHGDFLDVVECCDVTRLDAFQFLLVENRMRLCMGENISEVGELYFKEGFFGKGFESRDSSISSLGDSHSFFHLDLPYFLHSLCLCVYSWMA